MASDLAVRGARVLTDACTLTLQLFHNKVNGRCKPLDSVLVTKEDFYIVCILSKLRKKALVKEVFFNAPLQEHLKAINPVGNI